MLGDVDDIREAIVARVSAAFAAEIDRRDPAAATPWPLWPDVFALVDHLGRNYLWVAGTVRTGKQVDRKQLSRAPRTGTRDWFEGCRAEMLAAFNDTPADQPCWVLGDSTGTGAFWRRRMVYETAKHVMDIRASGGGTWEAAPELAPLDYADGIDELFEVFLTRSRPNLAPLPSRLVLSATDLPRRWSIEPDWSVSDDASEAGTTLAATAADLALVVWERANPLGGDQRYRLTGERETVAALIAAPVHP